MKSMPSQIREFNSARLPPPTAIPVAADWQAFAHLDLEIGSGTGMFARDYCLKHPQRALIAIEKTHTRSRQLLSSALTKTPSNLFAYQSDAVSFVSHFVPDFALERIFILYPNPYQKSRHANLRWHNRPFMRCLLEKLKTGGTMTFATNIESYFLEAKAQFTSGWQLRVASCEKISSETFPDYAPRTLFEKKYLARGEICWNLVLQKI